MSWGADAVGKVVELALGMPWWFWVAVGVAGLYVLAEQIAKGYRR